MKKCFVWVAVLLLACACKEVPVVTVEVKNPIALDREGEMVELALDDLTERLQLSDTSDVVVLDENEMQVPAQVTSDGKLIFPVSVKANAANVYVVKAGTPAPVETSACGRQYPERVDDIAWENDLSAYRTYGPALQATGERAFGYDVWVKSVPDMVVEKRYANELNPETKQKIEELRKTDPKAADELYKSVSYHVDHGDGLDCYKVGPTLGGGTSALLNSDSTIVYPYCYKDFEILDNGPLRFKVRLTYNPLTVNGDTNVIETRVISLDKGSRLNKTVVSYENLSKETPVVTGLVIHPENPEAYKTDTANGYIAYEDLTDNVNNNNGKIYVGAVFPAAVNATGARLFSEKESKDERGGASGHVVAYSNYAPGADYVYYWGSGWSKAGMDSMDKWAGYLNDYAQKVRNPLTVTLK